MTSGRDCPGLDPGHHPLPLLEVPDQVRDGEVR